MPNCNGACQNCCSQLSPAVFSSLTVARRDDVISLLRNNASSITNITASEISATAQQELQACRSKIRECKGEKMQLDGLVIFLENQEKGLERICDDWKSFDAPIRRIPVEILRNIFVLFDGKSEIAGPETKIDGFVLAAVSYHWRVVALGTRALWADISLSPSLDEPSKQLEILDRLLQLSGQHPLTFHLPEYAPALDARIVDRLLHHSHRWFHADFSFHCPPILDNPALSLPNLECLELHGDSRACRWPTTPKLQALHIDSGYYAGDLASLPSFSFTPNDLGTTITYLGLERFPLDTVLQLISRSPNLGRVKLHLCEIKAVTNAALPACHSPLSVLSTSDCPFSFLDALFEHLDCPKLTKLTASINHPRPSSERQFPDLSLQKMLHRTDAKLECLSLQRFIISDSMVAQILEQTPFLSALTLYSSSIQLSPSILNRMDANREFSRLMVPNLRHLTLVLKVHEPAFSTGAFVDMIRSRWVPASTSASQLPVSGLKSVTASFSGQLDDDELSPLKVLKASGMAIVLTDSRGSICLNSDSE
ncbi:hypothetical protein C8J56DRAFT_382427 [Mycena floridula]|nr:hypothetical protein C8J56DRAFT_382427 [Mycena floridula]